MIKIGDSAPNQTFPASDEQEINLSELKGQAIILYFYPRDNTPGCTVESKDFRDYLPDFTANNAIIIGVSRDTLASHARFKEKQNLPFSLIADTDETLCDLFDVIKQKNMYGKQVRGIERSTFLFDKKGILKQEWRKVKVKGHVEDVLNAVKSL